MAQKISSGNVFGRIGQHFGTALAEQFPKDMERGRLAEGLKQLEFESPKLSPMQFYTRAISQPGITPQMVESLADLAKQQNIRNSYQNIGQDKQKPIPQNVDRPAPERNVEFGDQNAQGITKENIPPENIEGEKNPLREEAIPRLPWDFRRKIQAMNENWEDNPGLTREENERLVADQEQRELARPAAEQAIDTYNKEQRQQLQDEINKKLSLKLQKNQEGIFKDLPGEYIDNLYRGAERDLKASKGSNIENIAHKWSEKGLALAKAKTQLKERKADENFFSALLNKNEQRKKLQEFQKAFSEANNSEEFYNILKNDNAHDGFNMSSQGAASIAYPLNPELKKSIEGINWKPNVNNSRQYAIELSNKIRPQDSLLAIAWALRQKDPNFNQNEFFDQLREDRDIIGLSGKQTRDISRMKRELAEGSSKILPSWGDFVYLPFVRT